MTAEHALGKKIYTFLMDPELNNLFFATDSVNGPGNYSQPEPKTSGSSNYTEASNIDHDLSMPTRELTSFGITNDYYPIVGEPVQDISGIADLVITGELICALGFPHDEQSAIFGMGGDMPQEIPVSRATQMNAPEGSMQNTSDPYRMLGIAAFNLAVGDLSEKIAVIDQLLIEILSADSSITDTELTVLAPNQYLWSETAKDLTAKLVTFVVSHLARENYGTSFVVRKPSTISTTLEPVGKEIERRFGRLILDRLSFVAIVAKPFVIELKESLRNAVLSFIQRAKANGGTFAVDYEPTQKELSAVSKPPQCAVRGVGWNASTKAWVSSWLPQGTNRRICATFSTRKFGFHKALKMAIIQRLRSEILIYRRRKYPLFTGPRLAKRQTTSSQRRSENTDNNNDNWMSWNL